MVSRMVVQWFQKWCNGFQKWYHGFENDVMVFKKWYHGFEKWCECDFTENTICITGLLKITPPLNKTPGYFFQRFSRKIKPPPIFSEIEISEK